MADLDLLPERGVPALALVDSSGIAVNGSQTVAQLAARGLRSVCAVDGTGVSPTGATAAVLATRGIRAFCPVDQLGVASNGVTADQLRRASIRPMVLLDANGIALNGSANVAVLAQRGLQSFCPVDESGNATTMGASVLITNTTVADTATIGTTVGVLSVSGGTGTYTFTLLSNPGSLFVTAGTNGVNLNTAATMTVGDKPITVRGAGGVPTPVDRSLSITVTGVSPSNTVIPTISGTAAVDSTLSKATDGTWLGSAPITFTYRWNRDGVPIFPAQTGTSYTVIAADFGHVLSLTVTGTNSIGSASANSANTSSVTGDSVPNAFTFTDATNQPISTIVESNAITVAGTNIPAVMTVANGEYAIGVGGYASISTTVDSGNSVKVRGTSSASFSTAVNVTLTIGGVSDTFTITTLAADTTPDAFTFVDAPGVALSTVTASNTITVLGINAPANMSITGGEYSINGGTFASTPTTVAVNNTVQVRGTSSASNSTAVDVILNIGGVSDTFTITTVAAATDTTPDAFTFTDATDVALSTVTASNTITVLGINAAANLSITGGEYKINAGSFASTPTTVVVNDTVQVRGTSSPSPATPVNVTLTIGGVSDTFTITTGTLPANAGGANLPVITGSTVRGNQLTVNPGTWTGSPTPTFVYQWVRSPATPVGSGLTTYTTVVGDETKTIYCTVQAVNIVGQSNVNSAAVGPITAPAVTNFTAARISHLQQ